MLLTELLCGQNNVLSTEQTCRYISVGRRHIEPYVDKSLYTGWEPRKSPLNSSAISCEVHRLDLTYGKPLALVSNAAVRGTSDISKKMNK